MTGQSPLIFGTNRATKGITKFSNLSEKQKKTWFSVILGQTNLFEKIWYVTFFLAGILCLIFLPFSFILIFTVLSLYSYMIAGNLTARGFRVGFVVSIASMISYVVICGIQGVWGEVIVNVLLYIPMDAIAFYQWKKNTESEQKEVTVTKMSFLDWVFWIAVVGIFGTGVGWFLTGVLNQEFAFLNSFMIVLALAGNFVRNSAQKEVWLFYIASNIIGIIMWVLISTDGSLGTLPYAISFFASLANAFNGMFRWQILFVKSKKTQGDYLAKRDIKINSIVKIKRQMKDLHWTMQSDANWETRNIKSNSKKGTK